MSTIAVRTALGSFRCAVGVSDSCMYCGRYIVWATDRNAKPVALEPWADWEDETELHINHCACRQSLECRGDPPGVGMTLSTWRGLADALPSRPACENRK